MNIKIKYLNKQYFKMNWVKYFKDKTVCLRNIDKKIRTNNSLENFNRIFKDR
jgi:hypothetical protein